MAEYSLDARYLLCPVPVIRTQEKVRELNDGDVLRVVCTDPGAEWDLSSWCRVHGHSVISVDLAGDELTVTLRVGAQDGTTG